MRDFWPFSEVGEGVEVAVEGGVLADLDRVLVGVEAGDDVVGPVEVAVLALQRLLAVRVLDHHVRLAVAVGVGLRAGRDAARVGGHELEAPVEVAVRLLLGELAVLVGLDQVRLRVLIGVDLFADRLLVLVEADHHVDLAVAVRVPLLGRLLAAVEGEHRVVVAVAGRVLPLLRRDAALELGDDVEVAVALRVPFLADLLAGGVGGAQVELAILVRVDLLEGRTALGVEGALAVDLAVEVRVFLEAGGHAALEPDGAVRRLVGVLVLEELLRVALGVVQALRVGLAVAGRVPLDPSLLAVRAELDPGVDAAVELGVLLLADEGVALAVEVPEIGLAVAGLVDLGAGELAILEELATVLLRFAAAGDDAADEHAVLALVGHLEGAVPVFVELLASDVAVGVEGVLRVDVAIAVAVLFLGHLLAVLEDDGGVDLAVLVRVGFALERRVAVEAGDDLRLAVAGLVLFLADALAAGEEALDLDLAVVVGVELLALLVALLVEVDRELGCAVAVLVPGLLALEPLLEEGHAVEATVAGGVGLASQHALAVLVEGHEVGLAVALRVLLEPELGVALVDQGRVELAVAGGVLQLGLLRAVRVELGPDLALAVEVLVELDPHRLAVLVEGPAVRIAVEVRVFFEATRQVAVVGQVRVRRPVAVLVVELERRLAVAEGDEAVLGAVRVRVLVLAGGGLPVLREEGPDVDAIVEVAVALGALGDAADVVDELVEATVLVRVRLLLGELLVVVVGELDRRAGRMGRGRGNEEQASRERGPDPGRNHHRACHSVETIRQRGC